MMGTEQCVKVRRDRCSPVESAVRCVLAQPFASARRIDDCGGHLEWQGAPSSDTELSMART